MSLEPGWITNRQIEAARVAMTREMKRGGKVWIRIFPDKPITKKPAETRMGKGKGNPEGWVAVVKPGRVLFEIEGVTEELAQEGAGAGRGQAAGARRGSCSARRPERMKANEIRELTERRAAGEARRADRRSASACGSARATESIENPMRFRALRRDIARIQTIRARAAARRKEQRWLTTASRPDGRPARRRKIRAGRR